MAQTAVDYLLKKIPRLNCKKWDKTIKQAKEIERIQIVSAAMQYYFESELHFSRSDIIEYGNEYYNKLYGQITKKNKKNPGINPGLKEKA